MTKPSNTSEMVIYQTESGLTKVDARFEGETIWLTQAQIAELYNSSKQNIGQHIKNIVDNGELSRESTVKDFFTVRIEGTREVSRELEHYNLDMILSIGYRVNSLQATHFRKWATSVLTEYLQKGFAMNDDALKLAGGGGYWRELLERVRDIRSSEKVFWRQILDIFATSVDYAPRSDDAREFFAKVQNKMHFAVHKQTAAEVIYDRADANKPFMGLTVFSGKQPNRREIVIAKNYLSENELKVLNRLVSGYIDFAESKALRKEPMYMDDWSEHLDSILTANGEEILKGLGSISHEKAVEKASNEFDKYKKQIANEPDEVDLDFIKFIAQASASHSKP